MGEAFITRRGGEAVERTTAPSINFVSKTDSEIVVTFTNNDAAEAEVFFGITSTLTDTVTLAAAATSSNITFSGLTQNTAFTVSAFALVTDPTSKKIKSEIVTTVITTDAIIFTAATGGTTLEYDSGGKRFKSHTFTSDDNFVVSTAGNGDRNTVDYLIIAGGAAGGGTVAGGGGAGGYLTTLGATSNNVTPNAKFTVSATTFGVIVGSGGASSGQTSDAGGSGTNSSVFSIVSTGGGGGGGGASDEFAANGGSGGGAGKGPNNLATPGTGITGQGFAGGTGFGVNGGGGGGGGALEVGQNADSGVPRPGKGGNGLANLLRTGSNETRAGGGGGSAGNNAGLFAANGGIGGGGRGGAATSSSNFILATAGTINTGSGGGGGADSFAAGLRVSGAGGSGIVVIRYEIATV